MRHVIGVYTQRFNAHHQRDGALVRGRYRSRLVQKERYLAELVRYIHMNPRQAELVARAGDAGAFDAFVHARVAAGQRDKDGVDDAAELAWEQSPAILGDEVFVEEWRKRLRDGRAADRSLQRTERRWLATRCDEVVAAVSAHFQIEPAAVVTGRRGQSNPARKVAILVCSDQTPANATEVSDALGLNPTSLTSMALKYRNRRREDAAFAADVDAVIERLRAAADSR